MSTDLHNLSCKPKLIQTTSSRLRLMMCSGGGVFVLTAEEGVWVQNPTWNPNNNVDSVLHHFDTSVAPHDVLKNGNPHFRLFQNKEITLKCAVLFLFTPETSTCMLNITHLWYVYLTTGVRGGAVG